jgi:hypothetical protein
MSRFQVAALTALVLSMTTGGARAAPSSSVDTFKDWAVICDNLRNCVADGFSSEEMDKPATLRLTRGGAAGDVASLTIGLLDDEASRSTRGRPLSLSVDERPVLIVKAGDDGAATLSDAQTTKLLGAARNGTTLTISLEDNPLGVVSLAGLAAALRRVDDQQGRVGTVTALVAKGAKPASAVPPQPATPVVRAASAVAQTGLPTKPSAAVKAVATKADCDAAQDAFSDAKPEASRLSADKVLWQIPCGAGAYNFTSLLVIADNKGGAARLAPGLGDSLVVNGEYDPQTRILSSYDKGRGIGDCGSSSQWAWTGQDFDLTSEASMPICRGQMDWPTSYQAKVE